MICLENVGSISINPILIEVSFIGYPKNPVRKRELSQTR
jgi:hypothetical protein